MCQAHNVIKWYQVADEALTSAQARHARARVLPGNGSHKGKLQFELWIEMRDYSGWTDCWCQSGSRHCKEYLMWTIVSLCLRRHNSAVFVVNCYSLDIIIIPSGCVGVGRLGMMMRSEWWEWWDVASLSIVISVVTPGHTQPPVFTPHLSCDNNIHVSRARRIRNTLLRNRNARNL